MGTGPYFAVRAGPSSAVLVVIELRICRTRKMGTGPYFAVRVTPYVAIAPALVANAGGEESFGVIGLFYRFTSRGDQCPLHDGGTFLKSLWFPNGRIDGGVSIH